MGFLQTTTFLHEDKRYKSSLGHGHLISSPLIGPIPLRAKTILSKPPRERTASELSYLSSFTTQLAPLWPYPRDIRVQTGRILHYHSLNKGEIPPKDGQCFYFVLTGRVYTAVTVSDDKNGGFSVIKERNVSKGTSIGQLQPNDNNEETLIVVCKRKTELLSLNVTDFDTLLKSTLDREWVWRLNIIRTHPIFSRLTDPGVIQSIAKDSKFFNFPPRSVIIKDLSRPSDYVYLLIHGEVSILHKLRLRVVYDWISRRNRLVMSSRGIRRESNGVPLSKWICVHSLSSGDVFGAGEGEDGMSVVSRHFTKCLAVNRLALLRHNVSLSLFDDSSLRCPSNETVYDKFIELCQWEGYKRNVVPDKMK